MAVIGASALGLDYVLKPNQSSTTQTSSALTSSLGPPPLISNFQWQPTRVVNGKVYDATISLNIQSSSPLTQLTATLDAFAPTIPARAYPAEPQQTLHFTPSTPATGLYSAQVTSLLGGKQYQLSVTAKDSEGNIAATDFETPYVREFESLVGKSSVQVGAQYGMWFDWAPWVPNKQGWTLLYHPLLGDYDSRDPIVISRHLDWLSGHGIGIVLPVIMNSETYQYIRLLMTNPLASDVKIAITYSLPDMLGGNDLTGGTIDLNSTTTSKLSQDFASMAGDFLSRPNYYTIEGKPVVYLYQTGVLQGDVQSSIGDLRSSVAKDFGLDLFLIGDTMESWVHPDGAHVRPFDAISKWLGYDHDVCCANYNAYLDDDYSTWNSIAKGLDVCFIPTATPGFHATRPRHPEQIPY